MRPETWERAVAAIEHFNATAGTRYGVVDGRGRPSENAKRAYLRLEAHPDLDPPAVARIIDATLASRWWGDDRAGPGVVFGPRCWDENMHRSSGPSTGRRGYLTATELKEIHDQGEAA